MYRVNYGQGQVSDTMSLGKCRDWIQRAYRVNYDTGVVYWFIQKLDDNGEWWFHSKPRRKDSFI